MSAARGRARRRRARARPGRSRGRDPARTCCRSCARTPHAPLRHRVEALFLPADRGAERGAVHADLAFGLQVFERCERVVAHQRVELDVVELVDVDVVGAEARQAALDGLADVCGRPVLRDLLLAAALVAVRVPVVSALGARSRSCRARRRAPRAISVSPFPFPYVSAVSKNVMPRSYARRVSFRGEVIVVDAPPAGAHGPHAEADRGYGKATVSKRAILHAALLIDVLDASVARSASAM